MSPPIQRTAGSAQRSAKPLLGAVCGLALYFAGLVGHLAWAGTPLRPFPGCSPDPGYFVINLPAHALEAVAQVRALAPQELGKPGFDVERLATAWSPVGFVVWGAVFYALLGGITGAIRARKKES